MDGFPLDARTLLGTPRITKLSKTYSGEYFYYGLERALKQQLQLVSNSNIEQNLQLNLHVDGLPISKSSQSVLWPLLGQIAHSSCLRPFVIGIFHGYCKPSQPEEILNEFCAEYLHLKQNGFMYQQKKYTVTIRAVLCDAPARAFVTCTIGHNGFFACTKCEVEGDYDNNRMAFLKEDAQLRTDESFKYRTNPEHHKRQDKTPFEVISLSMVSQFPLDYMHLICLGIAKKILTLSIDGCKTVKFSTAVKNKLSEDLISVAEWIPLEFARRVRGLDDFCRWKATEHHMYFVAFSNDWCATVPVCWLNMKIKSLKWPPKNNNATIECKKASQPKENWNIIKYSRLLGPFGTYDEARAVEISAVDISTNDEEALVGIINNSQQLPKKRIVKKPARLHSFSDEDDNDDEPILKNSVKKNVVPVIPDPPKSYKPHIINDRKIEASTGAEKRDLTKSSDHKKIGNAQKDNMKQNNDNNNDFCNESFVYDDQPLDYGDYLSDYSLEPIEEISEIETTVKPVHEHTDENLKPQKHVNMKKNITLQLKNTDTHRLQYNQNLSILPDKPKIRSVVNTNIPIRIATCTAKKEQEETLQFQDDSDSSKQIPTTDNNENESSTYQHHTFCCKACRHNMQVILHKINAIDMHFVDLNGNEPQRNDGNTLPQFPIVTVQELENFNKLLKEDATARAQYKKMIKNIGGKDVKKHVRQALTLILNDEFSCKLSWTGQKKTIKVKDMKFVDIMIESMINSGRNSTIFDVQDTIQKWLQHASDRVRYTEKKHAQT